MSVIVRNLLVILVFLEMQSVEIRVTYAPNKKKKKKT